ncbi:hypothetical protein BLA60_37345 [Actinophytocola xinjiangensis]|uniref:N-acetyltransferase domain-containing protein n=1 Tax=Actinophytocola xinjiangensis TaxID=485602 RepID=A0A7Z0WE20_9PSEU|nr:GNAT family N-acetyltransferase [Actinophytocola xinjiangensis]OLF05185.1 hypothetical protein BLA60_37345 [Actinophytocola xinjiangensis]
MADREVRYRAAGTDDAAAVAGLHADSWQRHYRGAYADTFLDGEPTGFLEPWWTGRLAQPPAHARTILAECDDQLVGLAHTLLDEDPDWGALVDNLHVRQGFTGQRIGTRLLELTALAVRRWSPLSGMYLLVLEQNTAAQGFYSARGGARVQHLDVPPPGGNPAHLTGKPMCFRIAWPAPLRVRHDRDGEGAAAGSPG